MYLRCFMQNNEYYQNSKAVKLHLCSDAIYSCRGQSRCMALMLRGVQAGLVYITLAEPST